MITHVDDNVGRVMAALNVSGLADHTVVVLMADHGEYLGSHHLLYKHVWPWEELLRVPFIWHAPEGAPQPDGHNGVVSLLDFVPTLLDYAGAAPLHDMHSQSLRPLIEGDATREFALCEWDLNASRCGVELKLRTARTKTHKLTIEEVSGAGELYDLVDDPHEMNNVYGVPAYADIAKKLKAELLRLKAEIGEIIAAWKANTEAVLGRDADLVLAEVPQQPGAWLDEGGVILEQHQPLGNEDDVVLLADHHVGIGRVAGPQDDAIRRLQVDLHVEERSKSRCRSLHQREEHLAAELGEQLDRLTTHETRTMVLGHLQPDAFLGGAMRLDVAAARRAVQQLAGALDMALALARSEKAPTWTQKQSLVAVGAGGLIGSDRATPTTLIVTGATPSTSRPMSAAALYERSMMRPSIKGPRSLMRTSTPAPVSRRVTLTMVPKGRVRWAAVS